MYQGEKLMFTNPQKSLLIITYPFGRMDAGACQKMTDRIRDITGINTLGAFEFTDKIRYTGIEVR